MSISKFLIQHADKKTRSFHMPGHKGAEFYRRFGYGEFLDKLMDCDITEIPGADNLFQSEGIIKAVQDRYRDLYGVRNSYLLINGTSGGIIASILATVPAGSKLIMARNCHKSVFNALTLGAIRPIYAYPELIGEYGISGGLSCSEIERCILENPDAPAVILPSPNYYGVCSDIAAIAGIVHKYGKVLIVDQAHGAHLKFFEKNMPLSAEDSGADIIINSIHKTLASFTQSAVLNLNSDRVDRYVLEDKLQSIQSTSPSYLLMASLDINAAILEERREEVIGEWNDNLDFFYKEIEEFNDSGAG
ncbi:MAG: arginine decarboxylase, partial [Spirochaetes bacterium]|nr:arginine decarboxylase [Spirochaetota bacterium]